MSSGVTKSRPDSTACARAARTSARLPRVRDFRGLNPRSFDGRGNYALGLKEHLVFPEISYDKAEQMWGMDIVVATSAKTDAEAKALLAAFKFPFRQ